MIDKSTSAALDRIFDEMYNLISAASRIPLTDKIIVEESDLAEILDDLKEAIPREVKSAAKLLEEQKKELEADLEQAIQKGRRCGISDEDIKSLFELILEG